MKPAPSRSLAGLLVVLIVTTVSLLLAAVGALAYRTFSQTEYRSFHEGMELAADQLAVSLAPAAWNVDYEQVRRLMDSHMRNRAVQTIAVELDTARFALTRHEDGSVRSTEEPSASAGGPLVSERDVLFGDQVVGRIRQTGTTRFVDEKLAGALVTLVLFAVLLDVVLTLSLYMAIQRMVVRPLRRVERYADEVARDGRPSTALGDLHWLGELQRLTRSIDAMVSQLGARNADLARSNERFQRVIRLMPLPISLFDRDGRIVFLNDRFVETFGYTLEDIPDAHTWFQLAYPDPGYRSEVLQTWSREMEASGNAAGLVRPLPYVVTCKDGRRKTVEIGGMMSEDPNITVLNDITDRTRAEEELARHRDKLEELVASRTAELEAANRLLEETQFALDHAGVAILWLDIDGGRFTYVNDRACALFGLPRETLIGMVASRVLRELTAERLRDVAPGPGGGGRTRIETEVWRAGMPEVPVEIGLYCTQHSAAGRGHCIAFCIDITQRREAEQALIAAKHAAESAAQARSEFLANMSHEIRTPMNAVIGMTRLALQTELEPKQRNYVAKANNSAVALLRILNDILDFSKVEAGQIALEHVPFRLDRVFDALLSVVSLRAEEKSLDLLFDIDPATPPALVGDPLRLGQILTNLTGNAIKFTERGEVVVGCRMLSGDTTKATLEFSVRDTGIGMSSEQLGALFRPFVQGDSSISRRFGGTGLGLAISRRLAELMGGTLQARSVEGIGSTFTLTASFELTELPEGVRPELPDTMRHLRVLVVDDNPDALHIVCRDLEHLGLHTERALSGREALDVLSRKPPCALMFCDWKMPDMDGVELVRTMQDLYADGPRPAVVMMSACGIEDLQRAIVGLDVADVLAKPASTSSLHDAVVAALGQSLPVQAAPRMHDGSDMQDGLRGRSVLLVEDNPVNQELGVEILGNFGMHVTVAGNGAEALERLGERDFDCVLMDVQMPVMDGLEAARRIRSREDLRELPVIAMTAGAMSWEREQTRQAGMNDHVTKPVDVDELRTALLRWLGGGRPVQTRAPGTGGRPAVLDSAAALRAVNGAVSTYHRILGVFDRNIRELVAQLQAAHTRNERTELARLAHRGRGSAASVGAGAMSAVLERLERACMAGDNDAIMAAMEDVGPMLASTLAAVGAEIASGGARGSAPDDAKPPTAELERLRDLLASNDSEALDTMSALMNQPLSPQLRQALQPVARAVERYDFDQALAQIEALLAAGAVSDGSSRNPPSHA